MKRLSDCSRSFCLLLCSAVLTACVVNPVTGQRELGLISEREEIAIGEQNYLAGQQMQGGRYTTDPVLNDYVTSVGKRLVAVSDRPGLPYEFVVLNNSVPNAWAMPGGKIAINRGLLIEMDSEAELAAVLGHEIVHAAARHSARQMERGLLLQLGVAAVAVGTRDESLAPLLVGGAAVAAGLLSQRYSREAELEADLYGMRYMHRAGYHPDAAVDLQRTFVRLSEGRQSSWLEGLFASHPPSMERVEANQRTAERLGREGRMDRERYQARIATLKATQSAYDAHDRARKALGEGDTDTARRLARQALEAEPREALFHGLLGDIALREEQPQQAVEHYEAALQRNNEYFAFHLGAGVAMQNLRNHARARAHLEESIRLLPTATAHYHAGNAARAMGDNEAAINHYRTAAQSDSEAGARARRALQEMGA